MQNTGSFYVSVEKINEITKSLNDLKVLFTNLVTAFSYSPDTAIIKWSDVNGSHSGDLNHFNNTADFNTVLHINLSNQSCTDLMLGNQLLNLRSLVCFNNELTNLNVNDSVLLQSLQCHMNKLTNIDISNNPLLTVLDCSVNNLTGIDISKNTELKYINCYNMPITDVDISNNPKMRQIDLGGNPLTQLSVDNILTCLDNAGVVGGAAMLYGTNIPTVSGSISNLLGKGWHLELDNGNPFIQPTG